MHGVLSVQLLYRDLSVHLWVCLLQLRRGPQCFDVLTEHSSVQWTQHKREWRTVGRIAGDAHPGDL